MLTSVLWYLTGQKWSLCYLKVHVNRVRVIRRHLCIKPRIFDRVRIIHPHKRSVLCESVLTKFHCIRLQSASVYMYVLDYSQLRPQLFAKYIPNVLPPCSVSELDHYVQEVQQLQRDLLTHPDFIR